MNWLKLLTCAKPRKVKERVVIVSIPKAGTYLLSEVLKALGLFQTYMHLGPTWTYMLDPDKIAEGREHPIKFLHQLPLRQSLQRIPEHGFAAGHLTYSWQIVQLLSEFKLIFLKRDLRDCIVSYMRFTLETGRYVQPKDWLYEPEKQKQLVMFMRESGTWLFRKHYEELVGWNEHQGSLSVRFEDLIAGNEAAIRQVAGYVGDDGKANGIDLAKVLAADTLTKSSGTTRRLEYWSDEAEAIFRELRGDELNAGLGYL